MNVSRRVTWQTGAAPGERVARAKGEWPMRNFTVFTVPVLALSIGACTQTAGTPAAVTAGPMDPNSVTTFTLAVQPDSITGCVLADPSMNRPVKLAVTNNKGELLTEGG